MQDEGRTDERVRETDVEKVDFLEELLFVVLQLAVPHPGQR